MTLVHFRERYFLAALKPVIINYNHIVTEVNVNEWQVKEGRYTMDQQ